MSEVEEDSTEHLLVVSLQVISTQLVLKRDGHQLSTDHLELIDLSSKAKN